MTPRSDDLNRAVHRLRYDVLKPTPFRRLAFYQVGADHYNDHQFAAIARGNAGGLVEEWEPPRGGRRYSRTGIACDGDRPWFSMHGGVSRDAKGGAWANRGLVVRSWSARLGGRPVGAPTAAVFGTEDGIPSANVELTPPPGLTELRPGDFVEAVVELVVVPASADDYYGPNAALSRALRAGGGTWRPVHREAAGNAPGVVAVSGEVVSNWPVVVRSADGRGAEVVVNGGLGYVPVTFAGLSGPAGFSLWRDDGRGDGPERVDQSVHGRDFWQADHDPATGTWSRTYNVPLDTPDDRPRPVRLSLRRGD